MSFKLFDEPEDREELSLARQFAKFIVSKRLNRHGEINVYKWSGDFLPLINKHGFKKVKKYLELHCAAIENNDKPLKIFSASAFRWRFFDLVKYYDKKAPITEIETNRLQLSIDLVKGYGWRNDVHEDVARFYATTYNNYKNFKPSIEYNLVQLALERSKINNKAAYLKWLDKAEESHFLPKNPISFADKWSIEIFNLLQQWKSWNGDLVQSFAWHPTHPRWKSVANTNLWNYTGSSKLTWTELMKVMGIE